MNRATTGVLLEGAGGGSRSYSVRVDVGGEAAKRYRTDQHNVLRIGRYSCFEARFGSNQILLRQVHS